MPATDLPLSQFISAQLTPWVERQRWYAGKGRAPLLRQVGSLRLEDPAGEVGLHIYLMLDESAATPTTYQIPLTSRRAPLEGSDHALVGTVDHHRHGTDPGTDPSHDTDDTRYIYDGPHDPVFVAALLRLILEEQELGAARGHRIMTGDCGKLVGSRVLVGEQSNTSIILDLAELPDLAEPLRGPGPLRQLICKLFRVLHHGENPDVVVPSALSAAGSTRVPGSVGSVSGRWPDSTAPGGTAAGHLAFTQEFLPGVQDAWRVALASVGSDSDSDFREQAHSLGLATAEVHTTLAEVMGTRSATPQDVIALTRSMRARHAAAVAEVPALVEYDELFAALVGAVSTASWPALQRIHGDYHLGQVLEAGPRGWVLVDFEGEPLRPLAERTLPDLFLRDVAGMLRSFDYAAGSWEQTHPGGSAHPWASAARAAFLDGYASGAGRDPRHNPDDRALLDALELDKAFYEVVYEARNRPTWLGIPIAAIARIAAGQKEHQR